MAFLYYDPRQMVVERKKRYAIYCDGVSGTATAWPNPISMDLYSEWSWEALVVIEPQLIPANYTWNYGYADYVSGGNHWSTYLGCVYYGTAGSYSTSVRILSYIRNHPVASAYITFLEPLHLVASFKIMDTKYYELAHYVNGDRVYYNSNVYASSADDLTRTTIAYTSISRGNAWRGIRFKGRILYIRGYSTFLSQSEVRHNKNSPFSPIRDGLEVWYMFEEYGQPTAYDLSNNGRHVDVSSLGWVKL